MTCKHGHEYTPENTAYDKRGWRSCIECRRAHARAASSGPKRQAANRRYRERHAAELRRKARQYALDHHEERAAYQAAYDALNRRDRDLAYNAAYPERLKARRALQRAVKQGVLVRMSCERCGAIKAEGHHEDYAEPLAVNWLCRSCHMALHRRD